MSVTCDRSVVFSGYSGFLHKCNWPPRYNWNIAECGHNLNHTLKKLLWMICAIQLASVLIGLYLGITQLLLNKIYVRICKSRTFLRLGVRVMVFNATFNNISVISPRSVLLVKETRVPGETRQPVASHWHLLSHNIVSSIPYHERD